MNALSCLRCGMRNVVAQQPCPCCGLIRDVSSLSIGSQLMPLGTARSTLRPAGTGILPNTSPMLTPGTTLEKDHYVLLEPRGVQQWGPCAVETRWYAQETEPETRRQRPVIIVDVALPTNLQRQRLSQAARRPFLRNEEPPLLNAFLEQEHCFFVFANLQGETLQQRIDQHRLLHEEEALRCVGTLAQALLRWSRLQPPVMHGWICPAHLVQHGTRWQVQPPSALVAGDAAHFEGVQAPGSVGQGAFDLSTVFQTVYAGLTGVLPPPTQELPQLMPPVSAPFASLLAHGLRSGFRTPGEVLQAIGKPAAERPHRAAARVSGHLVPARSTGAPSVGRPVFAASPASVSASPESDPTQTRPGLPETDVPGDERLAYPQTSDALHALYWSGGILAAELLFLVFSR